MRTRPPLTALALVAALSGCAGGVNTEGAEGQSPPAINESPVAAEETTGDEPPDLPAPPGRVFHQALRPILQEQVTWFRARTTLAGRPFMVTEGFADAAAGWKATSRFTFPDGRRRVMFTRAVKGSLWMQMRDWTGPSAGCWLRMSPGQVPMGLSAFTPSEPQYVSILGVLNPAGYIGYSTGTISARLSVNEALVLFTTQLQQQLDLTPSQGKESVFAVVEVRDGRIAAVRIEGLPILGELERAGVKLDDRSRGFLGALHVEIEFPVRRGKAHVSAPPPGLRIEPGKSGCR